MEIGQTVRVCKTSKKHYSEIVGKTGVIWNKCGESFGVAIKGMSNASSSVGLFWFAHEDLEEIVMAKLTGYKELAVIQQAGNKEYYYALYDNTVHVGDDVLVTGAAYGKVLKVCDIIAANSCVNLPNITAEVICKVDTSAYYTRMENRETAKKLKAKMSLKRQEIEARKDDEYYASLDTEYAEMLKELRAYD